MAINSGIKNLQKTTNDNLQKAVKAVETEVQKSNSDSFTKTDAIAIALSFLLGLFVCLVIVQQYTSKIVSDNFARQVKTEAEAPRKIAEEEAKKIIIEAEKEAKEIIKKAQKNTKTP